MPSLILSSRFTTDSQILRSAARNLGWETLRLDGTSLPDWFEPPDEQIALFYTAPEAFDVASQLNRRMVGCPPDWTVSLPHFLLSREIYQTTLQEALSISQPRFVKHAISKAFPAAVYCSKSLAKATEKIPRQSLVHVGEPVQFELEFRCFVFERTIAAISLYRRDGTAFSDHEPLLNENGNEQEAAVEFANSVLATEEVKCPPAFVLDIGYITERGWAVVEFNECWASGIYGCQPDRVLETLIHACVFADKSIEPWDFQRHYADACPPYESIE